MKKPYILIVAVLVISLGMFLVAYGLPTVQVGKKLNKKPLIKKPTMISEKITIQTTDGVSIVGDWQMPPNAKSAVLLLHMMPAVRGSWSPLSKALNTAGVATLAIDLRGHGESTLRPFDKLTAGEAQGDTSGAKLDYQKFTAKEHQASRLDVDASMNFLKRKGFKEDKIAFVGASIGSNLSIDAMQRYGDAKRAVALSPGLDYRGVLTESAIKGLTSNQKVWLVSAKEDEYSAESCETLYALQKKYSTVTIFSGIEHGTDLFASEATLIPDIVKFLQ